MENFDLLLNIIENRSKLAEQIPELIASIARQQRQASVINEPNENNRLAGSVTIRTKKEAQIQKQLRKEEKKTEKEFKKIVLTMGHEDKMALEIARMEQMKRREQELRESTTVEYLSMKARPKKLPFVFDALQSAQMANIDFCGIKMTLPEGTTRRITSKFHEVNVPPQGRAHNMDVHPVMIQNLDPLGQLAFEGFKKLNTIQSIVFDQAYKTKENMLICAPTGAGKTNIAMLTVLKTIRDHCDEQGRILKDTFKIIYIAPMKALASEMTTNFSKRLQKMGLKVKELTGDTQLTRQEIQETQMLILTPEKWDVVTRKVDDETLTQLVRLLIIDEVHLLADERGPVIETIVARTFRQVWHMNLTQTDDLNLG